MRSIHACVVGFLATLLLFSLGCDRTESFKLTNGTTRDIVVTYQILSEKDRSVLEDNSYRLSPDQSIDTSKTASLTGDKGYTIFNSRHLLVVVARADRLEIYTRTFTYDELKDLDFRIEITEAATPTPSATP